MNNNTIHLPWCLSRPSVWADKETLWRFTQISRLSSSQTSLYKQGIKPRSNRYVIGMLNVVVSQEPIRYKEECYCTQSSLNIKYIPHTCWTREYLNWPCLPHTSLWLYFLHCIQYDGSLSQGVIFWHYIWNAITPWWMAITV